jgi:hypothetical protein
MVWYGMVGAGRGFSAGLFFIDRKQIGPRIYEKYQADKSVLSAKQTEVPSPIGAPPSSEA